MGKPKTEVLQDQDWRSMKAYGARSSVLWCGNYDWFLKHWNTFHPDLENLNGQNTQRHLAACIWKMRGFHWIRSRSGTWNFRKGSTSAHMRRVLVRHQQFHYQGKQDVSHISAGSNNYAFIVVLKLLGFPNMSSNELCNGTTVKPTVTNSQLFHQNQQWS